MCGICGIAHAARERSVDPARLRRMTDCLRHRGPDGEGFHRAPGIGLGVRRLAIIDLETGDQPVSSEDGAVTVVCNGEIYNFEALRRDLEARGHRFQGGSDVEVIPHLYQEEGPTCVQRLRGMFAFALWDRRRARLMLARDRLGIKPLHYALTPESLYFASEWKAILAADAVARDVDPRALDDLFAYGFILGPKTLFTRIRRVPPAHYLLYGNGAVALHRYWDLDFPDRRAPATVSAQAWAEALHAKLEETVRLHLRSDVPVGILLSGGLDSSTVAAFASRVAPGPLPAFTLDFEDPALDESARSTLDRFPGFGLVGRRGLCRRTDLARLPDALWYSEDPFVSGVEISRLLLSELAAREVRVALTGEGADELLGGYYWHRVDRWLRPWAVLPLALRRAVLRIPGVATRHPFGARVLLAPPEMGLARYAALVGVLEPAERAALFSQGFRARLARAEPEPGLDLPQRFDAWDPMAQLKYVELRTRLPDLVLHKVDRASMAMGLEVRVPFLDHELVELCARIPSRLKLGGGTEKRVLREAVRGMLPEEIRLRPKHALRAPIQQWLREPLPDFAAELLSPAALRGAGYFDPEVVTAWLRAHRAGHRRFEARLMGVLSVQLLDDIFVRGRRGHPATERSPSPAPLR